MSSKHDIPYQQLGTRLKILREKSHESVAEVSGAVEIEEKALAKIESGVERPSEDILLLLISHFDLQDDSATELMQLAGYEDRSPSDDSGADRHDARSQAMMIMIDPRVMYSDSVEVVANQQGIVLNFSQANGPAGQPLTVSRVGMSREEAKIVMGLLHQVLYNLDNPENGRRLVGGPDA